MRSFLGMTPTHKSCGCMHGMCDCGSESRERTTEEKLKWVKQRIEDSLNEYDEILKEAADKLSIAKKETEEEKASLRKTDRAIKNRSYRTLQNDNKNHIKNIQMLERVIKNKENIIDYLFSLMPSVYSIYLECDDDEFPRVMKQFKVECTITESKKRTSGAYGS